MPASPPNPPPTWHLYLELIRWQTLGVTLYTLVLSVQGIFLAASLSDPPAPPAHVLATTLKTCLGGFLGRSFGCAWNEIIDRDIDRQVTRTRKRVVARGALAVRSALCFTFALLGLGALLTACLFPPLCFALGAVHVLLVVVYPFAKRFTYYPSVLLGAAQAFSIVFAHAALRAPYASLGEVAADAPAVGLLFLTGVAWIVAVDALYTKEDAEDDVRIGVKSVMIRWERRQRAFVVVVGGLQAALGLGIGGVAGFTPLAFAVLLLASSSVLCMVLALDLEDPASCRWWFTTGALITGSLYVFAMFVEYVARVSKAQWLGSNLGFG